MSGGLFGSTMLEIAIGLAFMYLLLAVFVTTVNEWIAGVLRTRAASLQEGIKELLDCQALANSTFLAAFYQHPLITSMMRSGQHPSYLHARAFANVVMDLATPNNPGSITYQDLENGIKAWP